MAIICNYNLSPDRIGGMDRFYIAFDAKAKKQSYEVDWFFPVYNGFEFFKDLTIHNSNNERLSDFFINHIKNTGVSYDVVITHFVELCTSFYKEIKSLNNKAHIIAVDHNPRPLEGFPFKKRIKNKLKGMLYGKYINQFIGVSKYTTYHILNDYGKHLKKKTKVVYNGIDINVFQKRTQLNDFKFIVASHLRPSKGIQDLIEAVSLIDKSIASKMQIDIYGEGPMQDELLKLTNHNNLEDIISFKGSSPKLHKLFSNYSYMIQPTYMECFSLSILESLSANIPVITTQVGGNLEVINDGENGFIFNAGNIEKLKQILEDIVTQKRGITMDVSLLVKDNYYLDKMVEDHIKLLPCI